MKLPEKNITVSTSAVTNNSKQSYSVVCRGSWLSLAQAEIFKLKVAAKFPGITIEIIIRETAGDKNQSTPLHLVEGKDFFTKDIQDFLQSGQADFAVHSMKDVSGEEFFQNSHYSIIDREDIRDVAIFNSNIIDKLKAGRKIIIGTSSPRRTNMATDFLQKALPQFHYNHSIVEAISIRGNVDARLQKLTADNQFDGIILAVAGLNRLLNYRSSKATVSLLLKDKKIMFLPLFECPPAAGQGAIVAETSSGNKAAIEILEAIKDTGFHDAIQEERKCANQYGYGCSQQFGVFHIDTPSISLTYAAGKDTSGAPFTEWNFKALSEKINGKLFSSTDYMKDFFTYHLLKTEHIKEATKAVFISSHKAIHSAGLIKQLPEKKVWAAGTRTWLELAKKGIWVEGCADGLGLQFAEQVMQNKMANILSSQTEIITNTSSADIWNKNGRKAIGTYQLIPALTIEIENKIREADLVFWTSFQQYQLCKKLLKNNVKHSCLPGKTAGLLQQEGISPIVFPGIKAFTEWRKKHTIATEGE